MKKHQNHRSFDSNPTIITQTMEEGEDIFKMDLENYPISIIEGILFKLEGELKIEAQTL